MRRWHQERNLMLRRWRKELATHVYDGHSYTGVYPRESLAPASVACDVSCHCAAGMGTMRKRTLSGHSHACMLCNYSKYLPKNRYEVRREAIEFELGSE